MNKKLLLILTLGILGLTQTADAWWGGWRGGWGPGWRGGWGGWRGGWGGWRGGWGPWGYPNRGALAADVIGGTVAGVASAATGYPYGGYYGYPYWY